MKQLLALLSVLALTFSCQSKELQLNTSNTIAIEGEISILSVFRFVAELDKLNEGSSNKPIYLYIHSPGGDVMASESIILLAKQSRRPVNTVTIVAASAAFNIVEGLGTRYITDHSVLLTHNAFFERFPINEDSHEELKKATEVLFKIYKRIADRMNLSYENYLNFMRYELPVRGKNNIKINTADEVVEINCSKELILNGICIQ